jgi:predicted homoserine dehydrogenase-like protein
MHEPSAAIDDLPRLFRPKAEGGLLEREGVVDLANAVAADGRTELPNNIAMGIWVVVTSDQPLLTEDLAFYHLPASEDKRYAALWRQFHLCGIETPMSILDAGLCGQPTAAPLARPVADVVAIAKHDLRPGTRLDGSGGTTVRGQIRRIEDSTAAELLPLGMADGLTLGLPVAKGEPIPLAAVEMDPGSPLIPLRAEHEALAGIPVPR